MLVQKVQNTPPLAGNKGYGKGEKWAEQGGEQMDKKRGHMQVSPGFSIEKRRKNGRRFVLLLPPSTLEKSTHCNPIRFRVKLNRPCCSEISKLAVFFGSDWYVRLITVKSGHQGRILSNFDKAFTVPAAAGSKNVPRDGTVGLLDIPQRRHPKQAVSILLLPRTHLNEIFPAI